MQSLKNNHFLKLLDLTPAEITYLLDLAADLKAKKKAGILQNVAPAEKRAEFYKAAAELGK